MSGKINGRRYLLKFKDIYILIPERIALCFWGKHIKIKGLSTISVLNGESMKPADGIGIGRNNLLVCHKSIGFGVETINVSIYEHDYIFDTKEGVEKKKFHTAPLNIGKYCWIGSNVIILKGTILGGRCVVGAGTILS